MTRKSMTWKPASVGCHWFASRNTRSGFKHFAISTRVVFVDGKMVLTFPQSGYVLYLNCEEIGMFKTLKAAQRRAERA